MKPFNWITRLILPLLVGLLLVSTTPTAVRSESDYLPVVESWMVEGEQQGAEFGLSVASAGDVNGDNYDDVIIGAPRYDAGVYREGAALLYYGSAAGLSDSPNWVAGGGQTGGRFGFAVASAGDVNNDGYDDIVVGAYAYNDDNTKVGAVYIFHGSASGLSQTADTSLIGSQTNAEFGYAVASAGDVNGDDFDDVIVGARYGSSLTNEGAVYLYLGSPSGLSETAVWSATGGQAGAAFGSAVASAGDVNGDGYADVAIGAPYYDETFTNEGAAFVFRGSDVGLSDTPHRRFLGGQEEAAFGSAAASAGDVNGDGYSDLVIGAPHYSATRPNEGAAFLYNGSPAGLPASPDRILIGGQEGAGYGVSVGAAGDINGDSYDDVVIGANLYTGDQSQEGAIFLYCGSAGGLFTWPAWKAEGNKAETGFGYTAVLAGDVNGDDLSDLVVGAPQYRIGQIIVGRAFGYHGVPGEIGTVTYIPVLLKTN